MAGVRVTDAGTGGTHVNVHVNGQTIKAPATPQGVRDAVAKVDKGGKK